ncbi:ACP S-malonyltransferase [Paenibacillus sp. IHBB 10380]|uniref:ACP S-malonyltransferase n=1 Tax=Paenibacillus sp. IHBB 10380 TaxID=1566358 RepID=UPI0005CF95F6|nr:ACP S-malonyltransferase [Paenibacillus sp. IHBB 10380]AJS57211.1 hypothetical protein UB51_00370 [Paenibacillus sp. IHBB 10380]
MNVAYCFDGQGKQSENMFKELVNLYPRANKWLARANEVVGYDLKNILSSKEHINSFRYMPIVVFVLNHLIYQYYQEYLEFKPSYLFGHSLGHYNALVSAEILSFEQALSLVAFRTQLVQKAVEGHSCGMLHVKCPYSNLSSLEALCETLSGSNRYVGVSIINSQEDIIISYDNYTREEICSYLKDYKAVPIAVAAPYHSPALNPVCSEFYSYVDRVTFLPSKVPIISNVTALPLGQENMKYDLVRHLTEKIDMRRCMNYPYSQGVRMYFQFSSTRVLPEQLSKNCPNSRCYQIINSDDFEKFRSYNIESLQHRRLLLCKEMLGRTVTMAEIPTFGTELSNELQFYIKEFQNLHDDSLIDMQKLKQVTSLFQMALSHLKGNTDSVIKEIYHKFGIPFHN